MPSPKLARQRRPRGIREQALGPWVQGVNEKAEAHALEFSELSDSGNVIVDERTGRATQRPGNKFLVNIGLLNNPTTKCHNFIKRDGTEIALITDGEKLVCRCYLQARRTGSAPISLLPTMSALPPKADIA